MNNEFLDEWREDAVMLEDLNEESRRIPSLHAKWLEKFHRYKLLKNRAQYTFQKLYKEKYHYLMGRDEECPDIKIMKNEVPIYLNADEELTEAQARLDLFDTYEKCLEKILNMINNRSFQVKNAIEWKKFESGY
tara:strand:+ start:590 stop:991 length:402 start_codon:yes stop_codon:yes gene_type:complete